LRIQDYNTGKPINLIIIRLYNEKSQQEYSYTLQAARHTQIQIKRLLRAACSVMRAALLLSPAIAITRIFFYFCILPGNLGVTYSFNPNINKPMKTKTHSLIIIPFTAVSVHYQLHPVHEISSEING
jgi:hypothetical protein